MNTRFYDHRHFLNYIQNGRAMFVITSEQTKQSFTFRMKYPQGNSSGTMFIQYKGMDHRFLYLGNFNPQDDSVYLTRKTNPYMRNHPAQQALFWLFEQMKKLGRFPKGVTVHHDGRCGKCGRTLTDPHSLRIGIGPECFKKGQRSQTHQAELPLSEATGQAA